MLDKGKVSLPTNSSITRARLRAVGNNNKSMAEACDRVAAFIDEHPEMDADFAKVFGITPNPMQPPR